MGIEWWQEPKRGDLPIASDKTGLQFSLAVNGSTSTTDKAKVESKSRWTTSDAYGDQSSLDHEKSESTSEVHFVAELGTENILLDFGISGGDSAEIEQEFKAWTQPTSEPVRTLPSLTLNSYSETSESHSSAGLVLGGDDPRLTSSGGYSVDIEGPHEIHGEWTVGVMIITGLQKSQRVANEVAKAGRNRNEDLPGERHR